MSILNSIKKIRRSMIAFYGDMKYKSMDRKKVFDYIYKENIWGKKEGEQFYSGGGSHDIAYIQPYCNLIKHFIDEYDITTICDLGCGDFYVASQYINDSILYDGIDIVDKMIKHHNEKYGNNNIHFHCMDIVEDDLPDAEVCLIRQVLQHLSNEEIKRILDKTKKYKYVIITEHIVEKEHAKKFNIDKIHGNHTRVERQSGLYFDEEPFSLNIEILQSIPYGKKENFESLISVLIKNNL